MIEWMEDNFVKYGDVYSASIYGRPSYIVTNPDYANHILRTNWRNYEKGFFIKRVAFLLGRGLMASEGEFWANQRRMMQPAFERQSIQAMSGTLIAANAGLVQRWRHAATGHKTVNVTYDISVMVLGAVLQTIFGEDYERVAAEFAMLSNWPERDMKFAEAFRSLNRLAEEVICRRRNAGISGDDILGRMLQARDRATGSPMTVAQLVSEVMTLVVAGHETTASTLNFCWYLLSRHQDAEDLLDAEMRERLGGRDLQPADVPALRYARNVIEETMRLYPPGWLVTRRALADDWIGIYTLPKGTEVYISPYLLQRHPSHWDEPDVFRPERWDDDALAKQQTSVMLPFSAGPRNCIGEYLARLEMLIHVAMVAQKLRLSCAHEGKLELEAGVNLRTRHDLIMTPHLKAA